MKNLFFTNNYWLMKFTPLALALAAVVIFFCNLYAHIWNGAIIYLPLFFCHFPDLCRNRRDTPLKTQKDGKIIPSASL